MAEHILLTRIQLRYGTYSEWMNSKVILKLGEAAVCAFPNSRTIEELSNSTPGYTPPAIGIKIGDGYHRFDELPWVQGIAADVYNWAKTSTKPRYTATEIDGLQAFMEENFHLSGDTTISPRIYLITLGTDENIHKFYLLYKENNENGQWIIDTNHPIDLTDYATLVNWVGSTIVNNFPTMGTYVGEFIDYKISALNYNDTTVPHLFITSISESAGKISVEKAQPNFSDISGVLPVNKGGTGLSSITTDTVLVGNNNAIKLIPIAETIDNSGNLVPSNVIKNYVDSITTGITGSMHFIGESSVEIKNNSATNPRIPNYSMSNALPGDVILYDAKEFVWTGSNWRLLGDEGSYAIKGSITNADIAEEANISQSKIRGLEDALDNKVTKVDGKLLSTNDYTDEEKSKLNLIEERAQVNLIEHVFLNGVEQAPKVVDSNPKSIDLHVQEFDTASQTKLENIAAGAQVNVIEAISLNGVNLPPEDKRVSLVIKEFDDTSREKLAGIATGAQVNVIESIFVNNLEVVPSNKRIDLTTITPELASKLAGIAVGAQVNTIEHVLINNAEMPINTTTKSVELSSGLAPYENKIENIKLNGTDLSIDLNKTVNFLADVNKVELIKMDGVVIDPTPNTKIIELQSNPAHENKIEVIKQTTENTTRELDIINKAVTIEADVNKIEEISLNGTLLDINNKRVNIEVRGFTSAEIQKLEGIDEGAQVNTIEKIFYGTSMETADELEPDRLKRVLVPSHPEYANVIEKIIYNNEELEINNKTITLPETSVNKIELIYYDGSRINPDAYRRVYITPEKPLIQHILINGVELTVDNKTVNLIFNQASLHLDVVEGAQIPNGAGGLAEVELISKKLLLARIAVTGDVQDLSLTNDTYIILDCGSSTTVID